jgi:hypothetical protein
MGGVAFSIERGGLGCVQGTPHVSRLSVTCLKVRKPAGGAGGKNMPDEETFLNPDFWQAVGLTLRRRERLEHARHVIKVSTSVHGISSLTTSLKGKPPKPFLQVFLPPRINSPSEAYPDVKGQTNKSMKRISTIESAREKSTPAASSHTTLACW